MKICLQAGHKNLTSGSTGATGERDWNSKIVPMIAERLRAKGVEVYETDYYAYNDATVVDTDWDLFLAVHYDADVYENHAIKTGGFVDYPEPSTDYSTEESQRICKVLSDHYFSTTGIKNVPSRSNANTRYYYMWKYLSKDTPCNLIECGVGWRKPEDYDTLRKYDFIADTIADGIAKAFGMESLSWLDEDVPSEVENKYGFKELEDYDKYCTYDYIFTDYVKVKKEVIYERTEKEKYKKEARELREVTQSQAESIAQATKEIESYNQANAGLRSEIASLQAQFAEVSRERDSLLDCCKGYEVAVPKLNARIKELETKLSSLNPLKDATPKELWSALFDKIFNKA